MATGMGLGGLAQGLANGLNSGFAIGRAVREREKFDLERPILEEQSEKAQAKMAATKQFKASWEDWTKQNKFDADGNELAPELRPDPLVERAAYFNLFTKSLVDNGAMDPDQMQKMAEYGNSLKKEGISAAMAHFLKTGDNEGSMKIYNSVGNSKAPEGTTLRAFKDESGMSDVGIFTPDGNMIGTMNQALFVMSADNVAKHYAEMQKVSFQEKEATKRTGISAGASRYSADRQYDAALLSNQGAMDREILGNANRLAVAMVQNENKGIKDPLFEQIKDTVIDYAGRFAQNSTANLNPEVERQNTYRTAALAYELLKQRKASNVYSAVAMAREELKLDTASPTAPAPKGK